jgi:hypothetical protein
MLPRQRFLGRLGRFARLGALAIALGVGGAGSSAPALAEAPAPQVTIGTTTPSGDGATLGDVKIVYPSGATVAVKAIVIKGGEAGASALKAGTVELQGLTVTHAFGARVVVSADTATLKAVDGPMPSAAALSGEIKAGAIPPVAAWLLALKADSLTVPALSVAVEGEGLTSRITYKDVVLSGIDGGRVASLVSSGAEQSSTGGEGPGHMTLGRWSIEALDLRPYVAWLDDELAAAAPKEKQVVYKSFTMEKLDATQGAASVSIDKLSGSDVKLGPPSMKPSALFGLIARMQGDPKFGEKHPEEMVPFLGSVLHAFEIGNFEATGLKFAEAGKPPAAIGLMRFENFAGTSIGEIRFGDMAFTDETDGTAVKLGSFAVRGFDLVGLDALLDKVAQGTSPDALPVELYPKPRITGIALGDLDAVLPGKGKFTIGGITLDTPDWVGFSPVTVKGRVEGFSLPVAAVDDETARDKFKALGLDTLTVNSSVDLAWKESDETLAVGPLTLDIDGIGKMSLAGGVGGVPKSVFENPETAEQAIATLDFRGLDIALQDGGSFAKLLDMAAEDQGTTRAKLAQQTALQVQGGMIALLGMDEAAKKVSAAIKTFITTPNSLKIAIAAIEPVPAVAFIRVSQGDEDALSLIKKSITVDATANK